MNFNPSDMIAILAMAIAVLIAFVNIFQAVQISRYRKQRDLYAELLSHYMSAEELEELGIGDK